ncbi:MAG: hypothetical protein WBG80_00085 [Bacteroidota bacterium]
MSPTRQSHLVLPFYLIAALVLTWPLARHFDSHLPAVFTEYDALLHVFLIGWGWHGLTTDLLEVFNLPIFYPELRTLTYMDHMLGEAFLAGPIIEGFGLGAGYNSLVILSFVASGYFTYRLARLYGISRAGSCVAGFLFAFCPYRFSHLGCLNQLQTQFIPLGLFFAVLFIRSGRMKYGVGAALTLAVQSYFGWYSTFHLLVALVLLLGWEVMREGGGWRRVPWRKGVPLALMSAALALPVTLPYLLQRLDMPEYNRPFSETIRCSADLLDYLRVNSDNILAWLVPSLGHMFGFFPGVVPTVLATVAIASVYRKLQIPAPSEPRSGRGRLRERVRAFRRLGDTGYLLVLGVSGFVLSLGPILQVAGHRLWIPLPYALFYYIIPGFSSMRTPGRFAVLVALAAAVLAGVGFDALRRRYPRLGSLLLVGTLLVAGALAWCPDLPFVPYPDRASMPPVYSWLAAQPDSSPVLELPVPARDGMESPTDVRRQMYVLYHGKPRLDGASGFSSNRYNAFRREMQAFPAETSILRAYDMGARRLIIHYGDYAPGLQEGMRNRVEKAKNLREVAAFGQDVVYEIQ